MSDPKPPKTIQGQKGEGSQNGKVGRPETDLSIETLKECCSHWCTKEEAAAICRVSADTIDRRLADMGTSWQEFYDQNSADGKMSLRRAQRKSAIEGENISMQIWLGKQVLGQKDRTEHGFDPEKPAKFVLNMGKKLNEGEDDD